MTKAIAVHFLDVDKEWGYFTDNRPESFDLVKVKDIEFDRYGATASLEVKVTLITGHTYIIAGYPLMIEIMP